MITTLKILRFIVVLSAAIVVQKGNAKTITVNSTADNGSGSLRQAIISASNGDRINIVVNGTITLTSGELLVNRSLIINGPSHQGIVSGNKTSRVFHLTPGVTVTLNNLTITDGAASQDINDFPANAGGGIYCDHARLTAINCSLRGNSASLGGAIFSNSMDGGKAALVISSTTIIYNSAGFAGGGIFSGGGFYDGAPAGRVTALIESSVITNNSAMLYGGGIFTDGFAGNASLTLNKSLLHGNSAGLGGGIYNNGDSGASSATLTNCTLTNNRASFDPQNPTTPPGGVGSAIFNDGSASLSPGNAILAATNTTVSNNSAYFSGAIFSSGYATMTLSNSSIRDNRGGIVNGGDVATIKNCTISGNSPIGGIDNKGGTLTLINSIVTNNSGTFPVGGGITNENGSVLVITHSSITANTADAGGGLSCSGYVTISDSSISGNSAGGQGGGIFCYPFGSMTLNNCTISSNTASDGGGIWSESNGLDISVTLTNCTVSDNSNTFAGGGFNPIAGGIFSGAGRGNATLTLNNCTLSGNFGWGVLNFGFDPNSTAKVEIANTILNAGTSSGTIASVQGTVISHGYSLSSDAALAGDDAAGPGTLLDGPGDIRNTNPMLGPLQNNGGPTMTHALLRNSPAINAGDPSFNPYLLNPPLIYDQRGTGFPRVVNGRIDIGAYEAGPH